MIVPLFSSVQPRYASLTQSFPVYLATTETPIACPATAQACAVCLTIRLAKLKLTFKDR